jgi:hypothetical protein
MTKIKTSPSFELICCWILSEYMFRKNVQYLRSTLKVSYDVTRLYVYKTKSTIVLGILSLIGRSEKKEFD